jgi:glycyl-tRNA synthetase beta chain
LREIGSLRPSVDAFFDGVMVMAEDEAVKRNRLALLTQVAGLFSGLADFSRIAA